MRRKFLWIFTTVVLIHIWLPFVFSTKSVIKRPRFKQWPESTKSERVKKVRSERKVFCLGQNVFLGKRKGKYYKISVCRFSITENV